MSDRLGFNVYDYDIVRAAAYAAEERPQLLRWFVAFDRWATTPVFPAHRFASGAVNEALRLIEHLGIPIAVAPYTRHPDWGGDDPIWARRRGCQHWSPIGFFGGPQYPTDIPASYGRFMRGLADLLQHEYGIEAWTCAWNEADLLTKAERYLNRNQSAHVPNLADPWSVRNVFGKLCLDPRGAPLFNWSGGNREKWDELHDELLGYDIVTTGGITQPGWIEATAKQFVDVIELHIYRRSPQDALDAIQAQVDRWDAATEQQLPVFIGEAAIGGQSGAGPHDAEAQQWHRDLVAALRVTYGPRFIGYCSHDVWPWTSGLGGWWRGMHAETRSVA